MRDENLRRAPKRDMVHVLNAAWARYVAAAVEDREAQTSEEQEQYGAPTWRARTMAAVESAKADLVALGVDVDALLRSPS